MNDSTGSPFLTFILLLRRKVLRTSIYMQSRREEAIAGVSVIWQLPISFQSLIDVTFPKLVGEKFWLPPLLFNRCHSNIFVEYENNLPLFCRQDIFRGVTPHTRSPPP